MGSEGDKHVQDALEISSLARILKEGQVTKTIDRIIQQHGQSVLQPRQDGSSFLNSFAMLGSLEAVRYLLDKGADSSALLKADNSTVLHSIVRTTEPQQDVGRSKLLSLILKRGNQVPVNHQNTKGWTALKLAAKMGLEQCVEVLLEFGADPDLADAEGYLPLHNAVGNKDIVKLLISSTSNVNKQTLSGETPLLISVTLNNTSCTLMLLEHGADPNIGNNEGITPLFLAARTGNVNLVRELLKKGAQANTAGATQLIAPLHWAAHKENAEMAILLIEHGGNIQQKDKEGRTPLSLASHDLGTKMIAQAKLRNQEVDVATPTQMSALNKAITACCGGNVPALKSLLHCGIGVNQVCDDKNNSTLLHMASYCGQVAMVAMLLAHHADWSLRDKDGDTVLHFACMKQAPNSNHIATLELLLGTPAATLINAQNSRGDTPLHVAIRCNFSGRAKVLIKHKACILISNNKKEYPFHRACCNESNLDVVLYLSELVTDINMPDGDGWTALMYASRSNCPAIVKYLLQRKLDPNIQQSSKYTALHLAVQENLPEICQLLLDHKADPNIQGGDQNVSPLHIAAHKGYKEICKILAQHGADYKLQDADGDTPLSLTDNEEIRSLIQESYEAAPIIRSNSNSSPTNSPVEHTPAKLFKSNSKEEVITPLSEIQAKLEEKERMFDILLDSLHQLRRENLMYKNRVWSLEKDIMSKTTSIPTDGEKEFKHKWWMLNKDQFETSDVNLNDKSSEMSVSFWKVHAGTYRSVDVAVKEVLRGEKTAEVMKFFFREVDQLSRLQSPYITQFIGAFYDTNPARMGVLIEHMPNGSLSKFLHKDKIEIEKWTKMKIIRDIIHGLCYLHSFPIVHRSLNPNNILLGENLNAKISDFGFHETKKINGYIDYMRSQCKGMKIFSFPVYTAPEVFERNEFSPASDMYSFGMIIYEIVTLTRPFSDQISANQLNTCKLLMKIMMGGRPTIPTKMPVTCQEFMASCWKATPSERPNCQAILEHMNERISLYKKEHGQ